GRDSASFMVYHLKPRSGGAHQEWECFSPPPSVPVNSERCTVLPEYSSGIDDDKCVVQENWENLRRSGQHRPLKAAEIAKRTPIMKQRSLVRLLTLRTLLQVSRQRRTPGPYRSHTGAGRQDAVARPPGRSAKLLAGNGRQVGADTGQLEDGAGQFEPGALSGIG